MHQTCLEPLPNSTGMEKCSVSNNSQFNFFTEIDRLFDTYFVDTEFEMTMFKCSPFFNIYI